MSDLQNDIHIFTGKIKYEPSMSGTYHMTSQVLTGDEYQAIQRVLDAARLVANGTPVSHWVHNVNCYWHGRDAHGDEQKSMLVEGGWCNDRCGFKDGLFTAAALTPGETECDHCGGNGIDPMLHWNGPGVPDAAKCCVCDGSGHTPLGDTDE